MTEVECKSTVPLGGCDQQWYCAMKMNPPKTNVASLRAFTVKTCTLSFDTVTNSLMSEDVIVNKTKLLPCGKKKFQLVSLEFFIHIKSFRSHYGPRADSASNRNEYQEYFLGVKAAGA